MDRDRVIEILTLEVDLAREKKAALEAALLALMREKRRETNEEAKAFMAGGKATEKPGEPAHQFCAICTRPDDDTYGHSSCGYTALCLSQVYEHQQTHHPFPGMWKFE
jgi:hypothetical protein